jgi:hypothetical protein
MSLIHDVAGRPIDAAPRTAVIGAIPEFGQVGAGFLFD